MRMFIAASIGGWLLLTVHTARAQFPPAPGPAPAAGPSAPILPSTLPPPVMSPGLQPSFAPPPAIAPPQGLVFPASPAPPPPSSAPAAPPSWSDRPVDLSRRAGFGFGLWAAPAIVAGSPAAGQGALGALGAGYGGSLSIRYWISDRLMISPALTMGISRTTAVDRPDYNGVGLRGDSFTQGVFAPSLLLGFAAYRGKTNRFLLLGGVQLSYRVDVEIMRKTTVTDVDYYQYDTLKSVGVGLPVGLGFEQFFTPKLSICLYTSSPIVSYSSTTVGGGDAESTIGADLASTVLGGTVFFYTD